MVLRKITTDNSVRYIPIWEKIKETDIKPKKIKTLGSLPRKQNKNISQNKKKFIKNVAASGFKYITKQYLYNCKNKYNNIRV